MESRKNLAHRKHKTVFPNLTFTVDGVLATFRSIFETLLKVLDFYVQMSRSKSTVGSSSEFFHATNMSAGVINRPLGFVFLDGAGDGSNPKRRDLLVGTLSLRSLCPKILRRSRR